MDKVSGSNNNSAQVYASQNSTAVQQTNNNQAGETGRTAGSASEAQAPKDAAEIHVFHADDDADYAFEDPDYAGPVEYERSSANSVRDYLLNPGHEPLSPEEQKIQREADKKRFSFLTKMQKNHEAENTKEYKRINREEGKGKAKEFEEKAKINNAKYFQVVKHLIYNGGPQQPDQYDFSEAEVDELYQQITEQQPAAGLNIHNKLDYSNADPEEIAAGIEDYAVNDGYDVPEGFGRELVSACSEYGIDYGLALAVFEANGFDLTNGSIMGFESVNPADGGPVTWQEDLHNSAAMLARLLQNGRGSESVKSENLRPSSASDSIASQIGTIASQLGSPEWGAAVYDIYGNEVSPALAGIEGVQAADGPTQDFPPDYLERLDSLMEKQKSLPALKYDRGNKKQQQTLYKEIAKQEGFLDENGKPDVNKAQALVEARLQEVSEQYEGRAATCMTALTLMEIAADYGYKLAYCGTGGTENPSHLAKGIDPASHSDCCNWVSWNLDKGNPRDMYSLNVKQLRGYSREARPSDHNQTCIDTRNTRDVTQLRPGDPIVHTVDGDQNKHTALIQATVTDPGAPGGGYLIVSEASGHDAGVKLSKITFKQFADDGKGGYYTGVNADDVYNGTSDAYDPYLYDYLNHKDNGTAQKFFKYTYALPKGTAE